MYEFLLIKTVLPWVFQQDDSQRLVEGDHSETEEHLCEDAPLPEKKETITWMAAEMVPELFLLDVFLAFQFAEL